MLAKLTSKNQITIPKDVLSKLPKVEYFEVELNEGKVISKPVKIEFILTREILPYFEIIKVKPDKPFVEADPEDDKFIWCALTGTAKAIVSRGEHLLKLAQSPVAVLTVAGFLNRQEPFTDYRPFS